MICASFLSRAYKARRKRIVDEMLAGYVSLGRANASTELKEVVVEKNLIIDFDDITILRDIAAGASGKVM